MNIKELMLIQNRFDREHGWSIDSNDLSILINMLHRDLVGMMGELGEFANILKKITLVYDKVDIEKSEKMFSELKGKLSEEIIDTFIYLMRIVNHLDIDLEEEYIKKLEFNRKKYKDYER